MFILPNMTDWHILPGLKIDVLIACRRLSVSPQNVECVSRYSASGHLQNFAAVLFLYTPQNSQPCKIFTLPLNSNQNLHIPAPWQIMEPSSTRRFVNSGSYIWSVSGSNSTSGSEQSSFQSCLCG